jgi:hypothetical protein
MVWAARSKVCAVFKYCLPRCEIWNVIVPSRGSLSVDLRQLGARAANSGHLPGELGNDPRTSWNKAGFATSSTGRDQTCPHKLRIARLCQIQDFRSSWALQSPSGIIVAVRRSSFFIVALHRPVRLFDAYNLGRLRSAAQLNVGKRRASKRRHEAIRRYMRVLLHQKIALAVSLSTFQV